MLAIRTSEEATKLQRDLVSDMYYKMVLTHRFEETAMRLFSLGKVHRTAHFCIGEEATGIGATAALEPWISSMPRTADTARAWVREWTSTA